MEIHQSILEKNPEIVPLSDSLSNMLGANELCTLATVDENGDPHANTAYFAVDQLLNVYLLTSPLARHSRNIDKNPNVAVTIFDSKQVWGDPHAGLQLFGTCHQVDPSELDHAFQTYATAFPALHAIAPTTQAMLNNLESRLYVVRVNRIDLIDELKFGPETRFAVQFTE